MLQIILAEDTSLQKINKEYKDRIKALDSQIDQVSNQLKTADDKDDLKQQLDDLHKRKRDLLLERDKKRMQQRQKNNETQNEESSSVSTDFKAQVDAAWERVVGKSGHFTPNKMYPVSVTLNGRTVKFGMFKSSGSGPIRLATLRKGKMLSSDKEPSDIIQYYKFDRSGRAVDDGVKFLGTLTPEARKQQLREFESIFK